MGRPRTVIDNLPEGWQETMIDMGTQGCSVTEIAVKLEIRRDYFYSLIEQDDEFSNTFTRAKEEANAWWERQGRVHLENREFNHSLWAFNMKNRFREEWADSKTLEHSGSIDGEKQVIMLPSNDREFSEDNEEN